MLFMVRMSVDWPTEMDAQAASALTKRERAYSAMLQRSGVWKHLWRTTGSIGNISIFNVTSHEHLHEVLTNLPFFAFITMEITPLSEHPGKVDI